MDQTFSVSFLLPLLAMSTFLIFLIYAMVGKKRIEERLHSDTEASSLARDGNPLKKVDR
ncbi:MAG: hypothetical protein AAFQ51_12515 [Pseudomonadota bacterium]